MWQAATERESGRKVGQSPAGRISRHVESEGTQSGSHENEHQPGDSFRRAKTFHSVEFHSNVNIFSLNTMVLKSAGN